MKNLSIKTSIENALKNGSKKKIKAPLMYEGFIIKNKLTPKGYKLQAYSYQNDVFLNPLYNSFNAIKIVIDALKNQ